MPPSPASRPSWNYSVEPRSRARSHAKEKQGALNIPHFSPNGEHHFRPRPWLFSSEFRDSSRSSRFPAAWIQLSGGNKSTPRPVARPGSDRDPVRKTELPQLSRQPCGEHMLYLGRPEIDFGTV